VGCSALLLNLQERLLRRRSDGVNVSRVVSGIRCHRSGLLSWFHNVRVLACTGRPYSGERCCSSAITREKNSLVRRDSLLREQFGVRPAPQLSRACATACVVRPQRDFLPPCLLRQRARRNLLRVSSARPAPLWQRMAEIMCRCANIFPRFARTSGTMSMTAPNLGGRCEAWRRLVLLCMYRCLQFRLRAMAEREVLSARRTVWLPIRRRLMPHRAINGRTSAWGQGIVCFCGAQLSPTHG